MVFREGEEIAEFEGKRKIHADGHREEEARSSSSRAKSSLGKDNVPVQKEKKREREKGVLHGSLPANSEGDH